MTDYTWVPWLEMLSTKIAKGGPSFLVERARAVEWPTSANGEVPLLRYGDENIDPMSFLYFLAQRNTTNQYERVFRSIHEEFGMTLDLPESQPVIPTPPGNAQALFHNGRRFGPDLLWRLFKQAAPIHQTPIIQPEDFDAVLKIDNVAIRKLTQTLFIANPSFYLPADDSTKKALLRDPDIAPNVENCEDYVGWMKNTKKTFPGCEPYEINAFLFTQSRKKLISEQTQFFQISTKAYEDGKDYWEKTDSIEGSYCFKENHYVYTGGPGTGEEYPLKEPKPGDVVLVRYNPGEGRAIGVVEDNEYAQEGWNEERVIRIHWINKKSTPFTVTNPMEQLAALSRADEYESAFRNTDAYKVTFDWIDRLIGEAGSPELPGDESDILSPHDTELPEFPGDEPDISFPLNTILFGPPGTGKTWETVSRAVAIVDGKHLEELRKLGREDVKKRFDELKGEERVEFVTFHQNYTYEDFIEGIRPRLNQDDLNYELCPGIFKRISSRAREHPDKRHVLIIDEINRGNIAKIFGELITLIEPSKRLDGEDRTEVTLPYSGESFGAPGNLYLIGTMNTADRGIALLDTALRRRFDFIEKMPDLHLVSTNIDDVDGQAMLKAMNERITVHLDREHQIGHTYLIGVEKLDDLAKAFQRRILPLLQEYFYDDWTKIRLVLGGNPFIHQRQLSSQDADPERPVLELLPHNDPRWRKAESYRCIYSGEQAGDE